MKGGQILGPFSIEELRAAVDEQQFDMADFVQTGGLAIWRPISRVLGVDGSIPIGAVAPDWQSILSWAWLRLKYNLEEQSLVAGLRRRVVAMQGFMFRDKPVTNLAAKQYATEMLAIDEAEVKARRTMRSRVMRALPAIKAARYMQLEEKIRAVQDYDAAAAVPLAR